ncbi:DNA endonuclease SmrA [Halomonas sp. YLGW01]|uniref:DNA endonuclease SmrA n=1 Tax=Halomonas sp. YLGW01 TaxID=2773308 RepID=UPI00192DC1F4|nr:DNA endonuclease SmrA [Halomonas sp. YLGW01]
MHMMDREFRRQMGDVRPLAKGKGRADVGSRPAGPNDAQVARRQAAEQDGEEGNFLSDDFVELVGSHDPLDYRRDGIQLGVVERLRHGGYAPEAHLHLQRRPLAQCRRELFGFIRDAHAQGLRSLMVVHGRGREDDSPANILRSYLAKWLAQFEEVQAFASAPASQGGLGATLVMLRKSDQARANNRERQQKRRG